MFKVETEVLKETETLIQTDMAKGLVQVEVDLDSKDQTSIQETRVTRHVAYQLQWAMFKWLDQMVIIQLPIQVEAVVHLKM